MDFLFAISPWPWNICVITSYVVVVFLNVGLMIFYIALSCGFFLPNSGYFAYIFVSFYISIFSVLFEISRLTAPYVCSCVTICLFIFCTSLLSSSLSLFSSIHLAYSSPATDFRAHWFLRFLSTNMWPLQISSSFFLYWLLSLSLSLSALFTLLHCFLLGFGSRCFSLSILCRSLASND